MRDVMLIFHLLGLSMGLGVSFTHAFLGKAMAKMEKSEAMKFRQQTSVLSQMGAIGMLLLLISGIYLIIPFWPVLTMFPFLIVKLVLVVVLIILILLLGQASKKDMINGTEENTKRIEIMGKLALTASIAIVISAVMVFH